MSIYHCSFKHGSKGTGASAVAKQDYITREGKYDNKGDLQYKESGNMPEWAKDRPRDFWKVANRNERANGRVFTEIEVSLPREITPDARVSLVQNFVNAHLQGHPYTVAIHNPKALDGGDQPHAHIIFSERKLDGIERNRAQFFKRANMKEPAKGGCAKDRAWHDKGKVQEIRESWERHYNEAIYFVPEAQLVTCKSLKAQGIDREPEPKIGPKGLHTPAAERVKETRRNRRELQAIELELEALRREIEAEQQATEPPAHTVCISGIKPSVAQPQREPEATVAAVKQTPLTPQQRLEVFENIIRLSRNWERAPEGSQAEKELDAQLLALARQAGYKTITINPDGPTFLDDQPLILLIDAERRRLGQAEQQGRKRWC